MAEARKEAAVAIAGLVEKKEGGGGGEESEKGKAGGRERRGHGWKLEENRKRHWQPTVEGLRLKVENWGFEVLVLYGSSASKSAVSQAKLFYLLYSISFIFTSLSFLF